MPRESLHKAVDGLGNNFQSTLAERFERIRRALVRAGLNEPMNNEIWNLIGPDVFPLSTNQVAILI